MMTNSRQVADNHWELNGVPLQGFICLFRDINPDSPYFGELSKEHCFVTAPHQAKDNWEYTCDALKIVLQDQIEKNGVRQRLVFVCDGSTRQVKKCLVLTIFITFSYI